MRTRSAKVKLVPSVFFIYSNTLSSRLQAQKHTLYKKYKYGLFKNTTFFNKRLKQIINHFLNSIKYSSDKPHKKDTIVKKGRTIYSRKLNKLFFRSGRSILINHFNLKKYKIQKYISKKIANEIKKPFTQLIQRSSVTDLLVKAGLFYSNKDAKLFIQMFGMRYNDFYTYNSSMLLTTNTIITLPYMSVFFDFMLKKKQTVIHNLNRAKLYKFRAKLFTAKRKSEWVPTKKWLVEHSCLYTQKYMNIEVDIRILTIIYLYHLDYINFVTFPDYINISTYMIRSYNWKYII